MKDILKGNFQTSRKVDLEEDPESLTERFEKEALKRLGGSIAYVKKGAFLYTGKVSPEKKTSDSND